MIRLKNGQQSLYNIEDKVKYAIDGEMYSLTGQPLNSALKALISAAVMAGIEAVIEEQYTDADFEKDIGLKT